MMAATWRWGMRTAKQAVDGAEDAAPAASAAVSRARGLPGRDGLIERLPAGQRALAVCGRYGLRQRAHIVLQAIPAAPSALPHQPSGDKACMHTLCTPISLPQGLYAGRGACSPIRILKFCVKLGAVSGKVPPYVIVIYAKLQMPGHQHHAFNLP